MNIRLQTTPQRGRLHAAQLTPNNIGRARAKRSVFQRENRRVNELKKN